MKRKGKHTCGVWFGAWGVASFLGFVNRLPAYTCPLTGALVVVCRADGAVLTVRGGGGLVCTRVCRAHATDRQGEEGEEEEAAHRG